jgi:hypothetical protein
LSVATKGPFILHKSLHIDPFGVFKAYKLL